MNTGFQLSLDNPNYFKKIADLLKTAWSLLLLLPANSDNDY